MEVDSTSHLIGWLKLLVHMYLDHTEYWCWPGRSVLLLDLWWNCKMVQLLGKFLKKIHRGDITKNCRVGTPKFHPSIKAIIKLAKTL